MPFDMSALNNMDDFEPESFDSEQSVPEYDREKYNPQDYANLDPVMPEMEDFAITEEMSKALFAQAPKVNFLVDAISFAVEAGDQTSFASGLTALMIFGFRVGYDLGKSEKEDNSDTGE